MYHYYYWHIWCLRILFCFFFYFEINDNSLYLENNYIIRHAFTSLLDYVKSQGKKLDNIFKFQVIFEIIKVNFIICKN